MSTQPIGRRGFLVQCGALAATGAALRSVRVQADHAAALPALTLKSWQVVERPVEKDRFRFFIQIVGDHGAVGYCRALGDVKDIALAAQAVAGADLLDHEALYDRMIARGVPSSQVKILDIAAWDLHARMLGRPLHAVLGTRKTRILRYGDVRGKALGFTSRGYAQAVATYLERTGLLATKLHFPGAMGSEDSIPYKEVLATLSAVREAVGPDKILAWDPYFRTAESATRSLGEAKEMIRLMDELGYAWVEGPLPPVPYETQIPRYVELMALKPRLRIQAEGPKSAIGDGTNYADMVRWVEAGAINQCSTDAYIADGLTNALRMMEYARSHPDRRLVINLHWAWAPHAHLAMAYDETICPFAEFPMSEEIPASYLDGPHLRAPDWPGIYLIE